MSVYVYSNGVVLSAPDLAMSDDYLVVSGDESLWGILEKVEKHFGVTTQAEEVLHDITNRLWEEWGEQ